MDPSSFRSRRNESLNRTVSRFARGSIKGLVESEGNCKQRHVITGMINFFLVLN